MYILFLPRVDLYVSFLPLANARGKTSWHKGLPVVKTIYTYGLHELFLKYDKLCCDRHLLKDDNQSTIRLWPLGHNGPNNYDVGLFMMFLYM
jgi:hypothetical protein